MNCSAEDELIIGKGSGLDNSFIKPRFVGQVEWTKDI